MAAAEGGAIWDLISAGASVEVPCGFTECFAILRALAEDVGDDVGDGGVCRIPVTSEHATEETVNVLLRVHTSGVPLRSPEELKHVDGLTAGERALLKDLPVELLLSCIRLINFLDHECMLHLFLAFVASEVESKTPAEIRAYFKCGPVTDADRAGLVNYDFLTTSASP